MTALTFSYFQLLLLHSYSGQNVATELAIQLPDSVSDLVTSTAFECYTVSKPDNNLRSRLKSLTTADLFPSGVTDSQSASCCLSGLWLLHNFLDPSHEISQDIHSPEGSYWHGIMHRLERDFWNSKYWYRKVGDHPVFQTIASQCQGGWNPDDYVDQCEAASGAGDSAKSRVQMIAVIEWKALFEFCYQNAI